MNLQLTGHHLDITPPIRAYVTSKLERITRHFEEVIDVNVILTTDKLQHKVEITLHIAGKDLHTESIDTDMYAAIDDIIDKLDRLVLKQKELRIAKRTKTTPVKRMATE
ncbi:MAG: ribosome-associated translation inhibitor RaiA [Proteobacteria bacterium]|nr:ribosome-associated translation inhibitor RaiA [Pseudomonadota bacterium]MCL2306823.1 ribosome-associated translation inhibitor RaiA [Pseudomonadota bacterium]